MGGKKSIVGTVVVGLVLALCLALAAPAVAGPRPKGETGMRHVIEDARKICVEGTSDEWLTTACILRAQTFSSTNIGNYYPENYPENYPDVGMVTYSGKNSDHQETAMARQASSAVLSIDDVVTRFQDEQKDMAAFYLCTYDQKARDLGDDRFDDGEANLAQDAVALALQLVSVERAVELGCLVVP